MTARASSDLAKLLAAQAVPATSGIIDAQQGKHRRLICLERGEVRFALSNVREEQFVERLVRRGLVQPSDRDALARESRRAGVRINALLREGDLVSEDTLETEVREHVRGLVTDCMTWKRGAYRVENGKPDLAGEITTSIPIAELILDHVERHPADLKAVRMRIGPPDLRAQVDPQAARRAEAVSARPAVAFVLERAVEPTAVADLATEGPDGPEPVWRAIHGLLLLGVLRRADTVSAAAARAASEAAGIASRDEIEGWLAKGREGTLYDVLGVDPEADIGKIRAAYYRHARRLHPDRIRSGPDADLLGAVETFFTRVTEAYNTLQDPEARREYDRFLRQAAARKTDTVQDTAHLARQNFLRGRAALEKRRLTEALTFFENAVRLDDGQADYHRELGLLLAQNVRRRDDAEAAARRAIEIDPSDPSNYVALAEVLRRAQRSEEAIRTLREALRWDPDHAGAREALRALDG